LPELQKLAVLKLRFLQKAERIFEKGIFNKREQHHFCEFVIEYVEDLGHLNEALAKMAQKYYNLSINLMSDKQRAKLKNQFFEVTDGAINMNFEDLDEKDFFEETFSNFNMHNRKQHLNNSIQKNKSTDFTTISLNDLYKSLAKILHPDLEQNETIRTIKVGLMQDLSEAKENKDLFAMLRIQHSANAFIKEDVKKSIFTLDKLKAFNKILNEKLNAYKAIVGNGFRKNYHEFYNNTWNHKIVTVEDKILKKVKQIKKIAKAINNDMDYIKDGDDLLTYVNFYFSS
jgi:hypothetical protein